MKDILRAVQQIDRRIIFAMLFILMALPVLHPLGIPTVVSLETKKVFDLFEGLPAGSIVFFGSDAGGSGYPEVEPAMIVILKHLFKRPLRIVIVAFDSTEGGVLAETVLTKVYKAGKKYGVDWVNLGYIAGEEVAKAAFAADIHKTVSRDNFGTPLNMLPLMNEVRSIKDFAGAITISTGISATEGYLRQWAVPYKVKVMTAITAACIPTMYPHYQAGILYAMMGGMKGAGEYELLAKELGKGIASSDALSTSMVALVILVLLANVGYMLKPKMKRE
jgi:hypothetical protein